MKVKILAIDPGTTHSGWCLFDGIRVLESGTEENEAILWRVRRESETAEIAIEMIASYGMPVGREVFETCVWIGRFVQWARNPGAVRLVYRRDVKMLLCGSPRAKDTNIRQALIDRLGPIGTKGTPGALYGVTGHAWPAVGVAVVAAERSTAL